MKTLDDSQLCAKISNGSVAAFEILVHRHTQRFFSLAVQTLQCVGDAEEVVQNAFLKFWQNPSLYDPIKAKFTTWFYRVILNQCRDVIKRQRSSDDNISAYVEYLVTSAKQTQKGEESKLASKQAIMELQVALEYAFSKLTSRQREALNLVVYAQLPQLEAAKILGISLKALESVLVRAKKQLRSDVSSAMSLNKPRMRQSNHCVVDTPHDYFSTLTSSFAAKVSK